MPFSLATLMSSTISQDVGGVKTNWNYASMNEGVE